MPRKFIRLLPEDGAQDLLSLLDPGGNEHAKPVLQRVLGDDSSHSGLLAIVLPFLKWLGRDELGRGTANRVRVKIINLVGSVPGLLEALLDLLQKASSLSEEQLCTLAWFCEAYASDPERQENPVGKKFLVDMANIFATRSAPLKESAARMLQVLCPPPPVLESGT